MPDPVPNPVASAIVTPPPSPVPPQVQNPPAPDQLQQGPGPQNVTPPTQNQPVKPPSPWQRAVHALLGSQTEYQQTPNGPVPVQVQNKPGQLFRSILAGAILGAGAGSANAEHDAGSGWSAAGRGAAAAAQNQQQQQQQRAAQAQKQWENQRQAQQDNQEEMVRKAQIAEANANTLRINKESNGLDYTQHKEIADAGKAAVQAYDDAGIHPVAESIPESQMQQYIQDHPGSSSLDWEHTGVKTVIGADGTPTYEYTLSAYDPKGKVSVPPVLYDQWKKDGVFDRYPEYGQILKDGKTLTASQYIQVKRDAEKVQADNLAKTNQGLETTLKQTQIDAAKAEITERRAAAWNDSLSAKEKQDQEKEKNELNTAWDHLAKADNDPSKSPMTAEDRVAIARNAQPLIQDSLNAIKVAAADPSQADQLPQLWETYHSLSRLANLGGGGSAADPIQKTVDTLKGKTPQEIQAALDDPKNGVPDAAKTEIWKRLGMAPPASKSAIALNPAGKAVSNFVQTAAPVVANIPVIP
jgi:hypothetical protein